LSPRWHGDGRREEPMGLAGLEYRVDGDRGRDQVPRRVDVVQLPPIRLPAGEVPAVDRYLPGLLSRRRKATHDDLERARFVGHVRQPATVRGQRRFPFTEARRSIRLRLARAGEIEEEEIAGRRTCRGRERLAEKHVAVARPLPRNRNRAL